jgi:hypothetical protein
MTTETKNPTAAEALAEDVPFEFGGVKYVLPPTSEWTYDTLEAFEEGKISAFLKALLGDKQHDAFKATKPKISAMNEFVLGIQKALGISGN